MVTTAAAYEMIKEVVEGMDSFLRNRGIDLLIIKSSIPVAPLATTSLLAKDLIQHKRLIKGSDLIIIPGLVQGPARELERELGVPVIKGTRYAGDLPRLIQMIVDGEVDVELLKGDAPADSVIGRMREGEVRSMHKSLPARKSLYRVKNVNFTLRPPPLNLFYELCTSTRQVCPSPRLGSLEALVGSLKSLGYSGVIIGCDVSGCSSDIHEKLSVINDAGLISGVDAYDYSAVGGDALAEAGMLLNIDESTLDTIAGAVGSDTLLTLIPSAAGCRDEVINSLKSVIAKAREYGFEKILIDPILKPPMLGLFNSLRILSEVSESVNYPILAGLCNVYELIDADTPGVIALLTTLLFEAGVSNLLVTEASRKACGAAEEVSVARDLTYWAHLRKSPPKDYTRNLLLLKDKRFRKPQAPSSSWSDESVTEARAVLVEAPVEPIMESKYLRISVNYAKSELLVDVYRGGELLARYVGKDPLSLGRVVTRREMLGAEHSLYLGYELSKAHIALKLLKEYIQDEDLFKDFYNARK